MMYYETVKQAKTAGYTPAHTEFLGEHNGHDIRSIDCSGPRSFGYHFCICAEINNEHIETGVCSVNISTGDKNIIGMDFSIRPMYAPGELERGIALASALINQAVS